MWRNAHRLGFDNGSTDNIEGHHVTPPEGVTLGTPTRPSSPSTPLLSTATGATLGMTLAKGRALYPATDLTHEEGGSIVGPPSHCERNLGTRPAGTDQSCGNRSGRS
jgi:hypothetical protein